MTVAVDSHKNNIHINKRQQEQWHTVANSQTNRTGSKTLVTKLHIAALIHRHGHIYKCKCLCVCLCLKWKQWKSFSLALNSAAHPSLAHHFGQIYKSQVEWAYEYTHVPVTLLGK